MSSLVLLYQVYIRLPCCTYVKPGLGIGMARRHENVRSQELAYLLTLKKSVGWFKLRAFVLLRWLMFWKFRETHGN